MADWLLTPLIIALAYRWQHDWPRLCEAMGFRLVCRHQAMLVKE